MKKLLTTIAIMVLCALTGAVYIINSPRRATALVAFLLLAATAVAAFAVRRARADKSVFFRGYADKAFTSSNASFNASNSAKIAYILVLYLMAVSFIIRADYILYTPTWVRQHDVIGFSQGFGQAAFIEYFCEKIRLIDFDPRKYWGFFQPPLHHMLAGLWLRLWKGVCTSYEHACENVQCLTLFYSLMINVYGVRIMKQLKIEGRPLVAGCALIALNPCFIQMSGSINNDILCILLQIMAVYYFLVWMEKESYIMIALAGLCLGLSMMTKLSGILLAPSMGLIFAYRLFRRVDITSIAASIKKYLPQYLLFGVISIPLGIWSPVRNFVKFGVPLNFTPEVGEPLTGFSLLARIIDVRTKTPFINLISNGNAYDDYNVPLAILKTSLTGEADFSVVLLGSIAGWLLLLAGAAMSLCVLFCMIRVAVIIIKEGVNEKAGTDNKKICAETEKVSAGAEKKPDNMISLPDGEVVIFLASYILVSFLFLINLCCSIPNFSSQDFRYIAHVVVIGAAFVAIYLQRLEGLVKSDSATKGDDGMMKCDKASATDSIALPMSMKVVFIYALTAVFGAASVVMYLLAGTIGWR